MKKIRRGLKKELSKDKCLIVIKCVGLLFVVAYLFYNSIIAFFLLLPCITILYKDENKKHEKKMASLLDEYFKETLLSLLAALKAGYSIENAFFEAEKDMAYRFGKENLMVKEIMLINRQLRNNIPIDELIDQFAKKTKSPDICDFSDVFHIARRSGGDLGKMMERTISIISRRIELKQEINLLVASKKYEQQIMNMVPIGIIFYIRISNPGYFDALYGNIFGVIVMTIALGLYYFAYQLSEKILSIT